MHVLPATSFIDCLLRWPRPVQLSSFACLQPAQVRLQAQHDAFEQQRGVRAVRLGHRGALRVPQPPQQLAALRVDDRDRIGEPAAAAAMSLRWNSARSGFGPAHLGQPAGDPLLPGRRQRVDLAVRPVLSQPGGRRGSTPGRPSPAGSA
jgi:hypothetical protein